MIVLSTLFITLHHDIRYVFLLPLNQEFTYHLTLYYANNIKYYYGKYQDIDMKILTFISV